MSAMVLKIGVLVPGSNSQMYRSVYPSSSFLLAPIHERRAGPKIAVLMSDLPAVRLGSRAFGVCESFAKCGLA